MSTTDCLDGTALQRLYDLGGASLVGRMIGAFLEGARGRMSDARAGLDAGELDPLARAMHSLRGTSGNFGALRVQVQAARLEEAAAAGDLEGARVAWPELEAAFNELAARLELERERCTA